MIAYSRSTHKIREALSLLSEVAQDKEDELGRLLQGTCEELKQTLRKAESGVVDQVRHSARRAAEAGHQAADRIKDAARSVDRRAHEDPWRVLGWAVAGAFALGFVLGRKD